MPRQPRVVIYIHSNQPESRQLRDFLTRNHIPFIEKDAWDTPLVRREMMVLGYDRPPVTLIDGVVIQGFQPDAILRTLQVQSNPPNTPV